MNTFFATYAASTSDLLCNYILANSIRDFAGDLKHIPLRIYISSDLDAHDEIKRFAGLNVIFCAYPKPIKFRYAFKSAAASACESDVRTGTIIWLDRHMIIPGSCTELLLDPSESFAYLPVHLKLLGASANEPLNKLWETVNKIAGVDESLLFPIYTMVDNKKIWPYFKADHFSFCAEAGIMGKWDALFHELANHRDMKPFLANSLNEDAPFIRTYLHQIALTLAILKNQNIKTLKPLPKFYGYPTSLHKNIEKPYQVSQMDQLYTAYYNCYESIKPRMPVSKHLYLWLKDTISSYKKEEAY